MFAKRQPKRALTITNEDRIKVRFYTKGDLQAVTSIYTESIHELTGARYSLEQRAAWAPIPPDLNQWRSRLRTVQTLLAEVDAQCVGFLSYQPHGYIDLLYVRPGFQRTGVAAHLYRYVEQIFLHRAVVSVHTEASLIAQPFFKAQGFHAARFEEIGIRGTLLQRWVMYKPLKAEP